MAPYPTPIDTLEDTMGAHPLLPSLPHTPPACGGGQTPTSIMAEQWLKGKVGPEAATRQTGKPQTFLLPDKWLPHKREGP